MSNRDVDRREFLKVGAAAGLGFAAASKSAGPLLAFNGSQGQKVRVAVCGVNSRGMVHAQNFAKLATSHVAYICDVDSNVIDKAVTAASRAQNDVPPKAITDFRRALDDRDVDAISIATPDHWHTAMALLAMKAGKHVYLEKPSGNTPHEDELLIEAAKKYNVRVQLGAQRRSGPRFFEALALLKEGAIGTPYLARTWYANTRVGIGKGKPAPVPANLDFALWQGPAPKTAYRDNIIHYNWHWFTRWGTGEICNNGTHEIDVARWFLGVDYPTSVVSNGGRFHFADDWEFPDTQEATWEFAGGKTIVWHGQSCNGTKMYGKSRGTMILGSGGSLLIDQDGWTIRDNREKLVKESTAAVRGDALNTSGDDALTVLHMQNWLDAIRGGTKLTLPIEDGAKTGMLCHLGTIAQQTGRKLKIDPATAKILGDTEAMKLWSRSYEPGWAPSA